MSEKLRSDKGQWPESRSRRNFLGTAAKAGTALVGVALVPTLVIKAMLQKPDQKNRGPRIPAMINLIKVPDSPTWISKEAREFLGKNRNMHFVEKTGALDVDDARGFKVTKEGVKPGEVKALLVDVDGPIISFFFLDKIGGHMARNEGEVITVERRDDGSLEYNSALLA